MSEPEDDKSVTQKQPAPQPEKKPDEEGQTPAQPKQTDGPSESSKPGPHSFPDEAPKGA